MLERRSEEEFSIADAAAAPHATLPLDVAQRQVTQSLDGSELIGEDAKLVRALLTSFISAEVTAVLVDPLKLLVTHGAEQNVLIGGFNRLRWQFERENRINQLVADLLVADIDLVGVAH